MAKDFLLLNFYRTVACTVHYYQIYRVGNVSWMHREASVTAEERFINSWLKYKLKRPTDGGQNTSNNPKLFSIFTMV